MTDHQRQTTGNKCIDAHQHFWHYEPVKDAWITEQMKVIQRDFLPEDLLPVLQANGVVGSVAVQADQSENETHFLLEQAEKFGFIRGVVGWVDLRAADIDRRLEYFSQFKLLKGFRHIVQAEPDRMFLLREDFLRGVMALARYDYTYDLLIYPQHLSVAEKFVKHFPGQRFVIDHLAKPFIRQGLIDTWAQQLRKIAQYPNVYCKLSGLVTEADWQQWKRLDMVPYLEVALEAFGANRLLFGSDWPVCLVAADYAQVKALVTDFISRLSADEQAKIMGGNAATFYKL